MSSKAYTNLQVFIIFATFGICTIFLAVKVGELAVQVEMNSVAIEKLTELMR